MRIHRTHQFIAPWNVGAGAVDPDVLAAVRVEPVLRQRRPALALDLFLESRAGLTVIPLVLADPAVIVERDRDPLVFPAGTPGDDAFATALAGKILPHLEQLVLCGERIAEHVHVVRASRTFDAARAAGCFGAAPLRDALARLAPYRYARRFVRGRTVVIDAPDAAGGWAMLRDVASVGVATAARHSAEVEWYGEPPEAAPRPEVAIVAGSDARGAACVIDLAPGHSGAPSPIEPVEVVDPLALDVAISFDPAEGPACRWFAIERTPEPHVRAYATANRRTAGGSAGRIAIVLGRADAAAHPSADSDQAALLLAALGAEGFDAYAVASASELRGADLVHCIGSRDGARTRAIVDAARGAGIPVALEPQDDDAANGGWWGAQVARECFEYGGDERDVRAYLSMLARRAVAIGPARGDAPYAPPAAGRDDALAAVRAASVVIAASAGEVERLRVQSGRTGPLATVPPFAAIGEPASIGRLVGPDPFALVHAPIGPAWNQLLVARAAADLRIPLVLAGPVVDASYLERVREFGGPGLVLLAGEPAAPVATALRAAAAVLVDAAWLGEGGSRLAGAALAGTGIALSRARAFEVPGLEPRRFDPADVDAIARALGEAWDDALRTRPRCAPETSAALATAVVVRALSLAYEAALQASGTGAPAPK